MRLRLTLTCVTMSSHFKVFVKRKRKELQLSKNLVVGQTKKSESIASVAKSYEMNEFSVRDEKIRCIVIIGR